MNGQGGKLDAIIDGDLMHESGRLLAKVHLCDAGAVAGGCASWPVRCEPRAGRSSRSSGGARGNSPAFRTTAAPTERRE